MLAITIQGTRRFTVLQTAVRRNNLLTGDIDWVDSGGTGGSLEEYQSLRALYLHLVENYETLYAHEDHEAVSPALLSYRLAEFLPVDNGIRQEILETDSVEERLNRIRTSLIKLEREFDALDPGLQ